MFEANLSGHRMARPVFLVTGIFGLTICATVIVDIAEADAPLARSVAAEIFGEDSLSENVSEIRRRVAILADDEAFEFLCDWVLPGPSHPGLRLSGQFTSSRPASHDDEESGDDVSFGRLVSPVFDLLELATRTGQLPELLRRVEVIPDSTDELQLRSKAALLILLNLQMGQGDSVEENFDLLYDAVQASEPVAMFEQWPETLVAYRCVKKFPEFTSVGDLLEFLVRRRVHKSVPSGAYAWYVHVAALAGEFRHAEMLRSGGRSSELDHSDRSMKDWVHVSRVRARTHSRGYPEPSWKRNGHQCVHVTGHDEDFLLYRIPVRGNFQVEVDAHTGGTVELLTAGELLGFQTRGSIITGSFRSGTLIEKVEPRFSRTDAWVRVRSEVQDGTARTWVHGRLVSERKLAAEPDPWVGIRCWNRSFGIFRDLRISGEPEIPEAVSISSMGCWNGWYAYHEDNVDGPGSSAHWLVSAEAADGAQIVGLRRPWFDRLSVESLLCYFRPLVEDGSVEYEFFYRPGEVHTHPALGRQAFLLEPGGVRLHKISDREYEVAEPFWGEKVAATQLVKSDRGLPLQPNEWNTIRLSIAGETLSLILNGKPVFKQKLDKANSRRFGLFYFCDQTEVRVRNVVMRGDWPRQLPSISDQQLADSSAEKFDDELAEFAPIFTHDFGRDGLPEQYFQLVGSNGLERVQPGPQGVTHYQRSDGRWRQSGIDTSFQMHGDFDVTVDFADLAVTDGIHCGGQCRLECEGGYSFALARRLQGEDIQRLVIEWSTPPPADASVTDGVKAVRSYENVATETNDGRIRIVRRGDLVSMLFAEGNSSQFRVLASRTFEGLGKRWASPRLNAVANKSGTTRLTWKRLRIGAEKLMVVPDPGRQPSAYLYVMNADGSNLRQITRKIPTADGYSHASPDWSPDGELIAFDAWSGRAETSHTFTIRPDGTGLKDLGVAAMPTFSADGKRLAFTWVFNGQATMNLDGEDRKVIVEDGWGAQWSPDGKWISYESRGRIDRRFAANVSIVDVETKETRQLLEGEQVGRYSRIYWNMEWSPDSRQIVFRGELSDGSFETCVTSVEGSSQGFKVLTTLSVGTDFGWHPDGKSILMSLHSAEHSGNRIFVYDLTTDELTLLKTQPMDQHNDHAVWSPDGAQIVFSSRRKPEPMLWRPEE